MLVDTNALLRFITADNQEQADMVREKIESAKPGELEITDAVLTELCFVMQYNVLYKFPRSYIGEVLEQLIKTTAFRLSQTAEQAIPYYQKLSKLDFNDCLLLAEAKTRNTAVLTFDKALLKEL